MAFCFDIYEFKNIIKNDVSGDFNQTKNITGFKKAILSSGEFSIKNNEFIEFYSTEFGNDKINFIKKTYELAQNSLLSYKNEER